MIGSMIRSFMVFFRQFIAGHDGEKFFVNLTLARTEVAAFGDTGFSAKTWKGNPLGFRGDVHPVLGLT